MKGLDYIVDLEMLSKCDYFISGVNGGFIEVLVINDKQFRSIVLL